MIVNIVLNAEHLLIFFLIACVIIQALSGWFFPQGLGRFSILLHDLTDPIITPIRRIIPPFGMIDLSPMIAILVLYVLGYFLYSITASLA